MVLESDITDESADRQGSTEEFIWTYTSPEFPMAKVSYTMITLSRCELHHSYVPVPALVFSSCSVS